MMKFEQAKKYLISPIRMEPEQVGDFAIEVIDHPPGYKETAVSLRTSYMSGAPIASIVHVNGIRRHHLVQGGGDKKGTLMSDKAQEMIDFAEVIRRMERFKGPQKILIGGLGLGYVAHWAAKLGHLVTVIEIEPDIIKLTGKYLPSTVRIICGDLKDYILHSQEDMKRFRFAIFDTWYAQNEGTYWSTVVPLRRAWAMSGADPQRLWCWKEKDEMWPQVYRSTIETAKRCAAGRAGDKSMGSIPPERVKDLWPPHRIFMESLEKLPHSGDLLQMWATYYTRGLGDGRKYATIWEHHWGPGWDEVLLEAHRKYGHLADAKGMVPVDAKAKEDEGSERDE